MSRRTPLVGFLLADAISLCGTRVSMIAIPWLVLTTTGSAAQTGLVAFAELLPLVVVQALAGPLIDRLGARGVAISCDLMSMVAVGLIPLLHLGGRARGGEHQPRDRDHRDAGATQRDRVGEEEADQGRPAAHRSSTPAT